jgi:hypothetical protein
VHCIFHYEPPKPHSPILINILTLNLFYLRQLSSKLYTFSLPNHASISYLVTYATTALRGRG